MNDSIKKVAAGFERRIYPPEIARLVGGTDNEIFLESVPVHQFELQRHLTETPYAVVFLERER